MPMPYRDTPTKFGGIIRIFPGEPPPPPQVIKRDFGLTTEPECSEEAHEQMRRWFTANMPWVLNIPSQVFAVPPPMPPM